MARTRSFKYIRRDLGKAKPEMILRVQRTAHEASPADRVDRAPRLLLLLLRVQASVAFMRGTNLGFLHRVRPPPPKGVGGPIARTARLIASARDVRLTFERQQRKLAPPSRPISRARGPEAKTAATRPLPVLRKMTLAPVPYVGQTSSGAGQSPLN